MSKKPNNPTVNRETDVPILESVVVPGRDTRTPARKPVNIGPSNALTTTQRPVPPPANPAGADGASTTALSADQVKLAERILDAIQEELPSIIREEMRQETNEILSKLEQALMGDELPQVINRVIQPEINALYAEIKTITHGIENRFVDTMGDRLDPLEKEMASLRIDIAHLKDQNSAKLDQANQMLSRLGNDHSVLADAQQELVENQKTLRENYTSVVKKFDGVATTQGQLAHAQGTYAEKLDKLHQQHQSYAQGWEKWRTDAEQRIFPLTDKMTDMTRQLTERASKQDLEKALAEIKEQLAAATEVAGSSRNAADNITESTRELEQKLMSEVREATSGLATRLDRASEDLAQLVTDNLSPLDSLSERLEKLQQDLVTVKNEVSQTREKLTHTPNPEELVKAVRQDREELLREMEERFDRAYLRRVSALPKLVANIARAVTEHGRAEDIQSAIAAASTSEAPKTPPAKKKP